MPKLTYTGDAERYYSTLGLTPEPGESYDLDLDPNDGRWSAVDDEPAPVKKPKPSAPVAE